MHGIDDRRWLLGSLILLACSSAPRLTASSAPAVVARMPDAKADAAQPDPNDARSDPAGVDARYIFDRNRLQDSRRVGRFLMALTDSGHLLRFDAATFALVGERVARRRVTCLGPVEEGRLLAALDDGTIVRVNTETLLAERVGKVSGHPVWLGQRPSTHGLVVAYGHVPERFYGYSRSPQEIRIIDLTSGRTWKPNRNAQTGGEPTTFLLDRHDRLWVGTDHGEWGGRLEVIDLQTGLARDVPSRDGWSGVFGLVELSNGQIWAYGGTAHMFCTGAFITRVDGGSARHLYDVPFCQGQGRRPEPRKSANPVTQIVELDRGRVLIFAYGEVSISDLSLKTWHPFTRLKLRYQPGRPDAVSSYPAVRAIHVVDSQRPRLVLATARDGYAELDPSGLQQHALVEPKVEDVCSRGVEGESFPAASDVHSGAGRSRVPPIPIELAKQVGVVKEEPLWGESASFVEADGRLLVVASGESDGRGTRASPPFPLVVARWDGTAYAALGGQSGEVRAADTFVTPDGQLWALNRRGLWRFNGESFAVGLARPGENDEGGRSAGAGTAEDPIPFDRINRVVGDKQPPWVALVSSHAPYGYQLQRFAPGNATTAPSFAAIPIVHHQMEMLVRDAIVWRPGQILLSTTEGLFVLAVKTGVLTHLEPAGLEGTVGRLARDRHGRVWLGGRGLGLLALDGHAQAMHRGLPFFGEQEVLSLAPCRTADVLVAIENGGVALVSLAPDNSPLTESRDELSLTGEPSREQTVIAHVPWIRDSDPGRQQRMEKEFWQLVRETGDFVEARQLGRYGGVEYAGHYVIFFHGPDAESLAAGIAPMLSASDAVSSLSLVKRFGPPGSPSVVKVIKPKP
jgi:hypothetical protein